MFDNKKWLNVKDIRPINKKEKNFKNEKLGYFTSNYYFFFLPVPLPEVIVPL